MEPLDVHYQEAHKTPLLKKKLIHEITNKIEKIVKNSQSLQEPIENAIEKVNAALEPLKYQLGVFEIIREHLLCRYANRIYTRLSNGIALYYDGRLETKADRLDPNNQRKISPFGLWSTWAHLDLDQLIRQYNIVHKARQARQQHPFNPILAPTHAIDMPRETLDNADNFSL